MPLVVLDRLTLAVLLGAAERYVRLTHGLLGLLLIGLPDCVLSRSQVILSLLLFRLRVHNILIGLLVFSFSCFSSRAITGDPTCATTATLTVLLAYIDFMSLLTRILGAF